MQGYWSQGKWFRTAGVEQERRIVSLNRGPKREFSVHKSSFSDSRLFAAFVRKCDTRMGDHPGVIDPLYSLSGFGVGLLVGMTGVGGGSLMTPLLILLFGIRPATAVGTDLLHASATKAVAA
jgi:Sulfite exporter TauE/SafE